jgi:putative Mg2+ transporter-C (MgtC) family protein
MLELQDSIFRLLAATLGGGLIGLDREINQKPAGLRTLMLVGLGAGLVTIVSLQAGGDASRDPLRVVQGIIMGIGFLGGGVILRRENDGEVENLTTAASIWIVAAISIGFGLGQWVLTSVALGMVVIVLVGVRGLERWVKRLAR